MKKKRSRKIILLTWIIVIVAACGIYFFSSQTAKESDGLSKSLSKGIMQISRTTGIEDFGDPANRKKLTKFNGEFRQYAHSILYGIFTFVLYMALRRTRFGALEALLFALMMVAVIAGLDEWHQSFVSGRGMEYIDWISDIQGASIAAGVGVVGSMIRTTWLRARDMNQKMS